MRLNSFFSLLVFISVLPLQSAIAGKVAVYGPNPHYLQDTAGHPMVIIGFGNGEKNPQSVLDRLQGKIDYQRASVAGWDRRQDPNDYGLGRPWPMVDGKADMDRWNETYWKNLHNYLENTRDRGIIVGLTIWDGHVDLPGGKYGADSVWNARYNLQGVQWAYNTHALYAFRHPRPTGGPSERLVYYQRHWIDRLIREIRNFPNVIIELNNEDARASEKWWLFWAGYFKKKTGLVVAVDYEPNGAISDATFSTSPLIDMKSYHGRIDTDITRTRYAYNKVIVADADNACTNLDAEIAGKMAWRSFLRGGNWNDFVCSGTPFPDPVKIVYYQRLLDFVKSRDVPFWQMAPHNGLVTTGLALAKKGSYYLIYTDRTVTVNLTGVAGALGYEWYDPRTGMTTGSGRVQAGAPRTFTPPGSNDYVLWITKNK